MEEEVLGKAYDSRLMRRLLRYMRPYSGYVAISLVFLLLQSLLPPLDQPPRVPRLPPEGIRSMNAELREASTPTIAAAPRLPTTSHAKIPTKPPVAAEPTSRQLTSTMQDDVRPRL